MIFIYFLKAGNIRYILKYYILQQTLRLRKPKLGPAPKDADLVSKMKLPTHVRPHLVLAMAAKSPTLFREPAKESQNAQVDEIFGF